MPSDEGWYDEDARVLARTFNSLTEAVGRFQREAGQRERLSALGRLSTVVAHEVRNPLMIIKGALRTLTRPGATAADVRTPRPTSTGRIGRLNRLVNDVLDFARPITFACEPTDVSRVCEDAVRAVTLDGDAPALVAGHVPTIVTDRDRLRGCW
ncbi:MAG: histidine kinase dimerization/phospho-acceptor domain-containing protein [Vicinamibacterales bacterium]